MMNRLFFKKKLKENVQNKLPVPCNRCGAMNTPHAILTQIDKSPLGGGIFQVERVCAQCAMLEKLLSNGNSRVRPANDDYDYWEDKNGKIFSKNTFYY
jgi:hypothetical protein